MTGFFLANPWGLLALLGLPAVLLIHLLRRQSRRVPVSTLFLIERALPSSEGGRRIRRLRNSLPLWVQLLAVCALAWLAAQPRWIDETSTQTVVTVLDASASMTAFRDRAKETARRELDRLNSASAKTQWIFLASNATRLASGTELPATLADAFSRWRPVLGTHDTAEAHRLARTLAGEKGAVVFITDRPPESVPGVEWAACGEQLENAGFLGADASRRQWSALLKNFGPKTRDIRWRVAGAETWQSQRLEAGAMTGIAGPWPEAQDRITLELEDDRFPLDNKLPLVKPVAKVLTIRPEDSENFRAVFEQLARIAEPSATTPDAADVSLVVSNAAGPGDPAGAALIFTEDTGGQKSSLAGLLVADNHPLMANLNWRGLIARDTTPIPPRDNDTVLLWQGERPLILLRREKGAPRLIFNFDIRHSNAARLPAFALLAHRFFSLVRTEKQAFEAANVETRQEITVAGAGSSPAPDVPGFFTVKTPSGETLFEGAAHFADARESDFLAAATDRSADATVEAIRQSHAQGDAFTPLWALLLAALMIWNWFLTGRPGRHAAVA